MMGCIEYGRRMIKERGTREEKRERRKESMKG